MPVPKVRVGPAVFHDHLSPQWPHGVGDVFVLDASPKVILPPWHWGTILYEAGKVLHRYRPGASLWLRVPPLEETGQWWRSMILRYLKPAPVPIAVGDTLPTPTQFSFLPRAWKNPLPAGTKIERYPQLKPSEEAVLCVLARIDRGYRAEIASLANLSLTMTTRALKSLHRQRLVTYKQDRWPYWAITRPGTSLALRIWGVPKGTKFSKRQERQGNSSYRHRRVSRLWNAWLKKAKRAGYTVIGGWSEVRLPNTGRTAPDALAWGYAGGVESLFWLEVEGGHASRKELAKKTARRFQVAQRFAQAYQVHLVFVVLGQPWAVRAAMHGIGEIKPYATVLFGDWKAFGSLPKAYWGGFQRGGL